MKVDCFRVALVAILLILIYGSTGASTNGNRRLIKAVNASAGCSLRSVAGTYGVSGGGTVGVGTSAPVQDTEVGLRTATGIFPVPYPLAPMARFLPRLTSALTVSILTVPRVPPLLTV